VNEQAARNRGRAASERTQRAVVTALVVVSVALVFVASAVKSYLPLFFVWIPQLGIPVFLSRADPRPPAPVPSAAAPTEPPAAAPADPPTDA
jgi:hypothetical protein